MRQVWWPWHHWRVRQRYWWCWYVVVAALVSCGEVGDGPVRGFRSRQLLETRDSTIRLWGRQGEASYVYSTGGAPSPDPGGATALGTSLPDYAPGTGQVYWSVSSVDGHVENLGTEFPGLTIGKYRCSYGVAELEGTKGFTVTITELQSGMSTVVDRVHSGSFCPRDSDSNLAFLRVDDAGQKTLWTGRLDDLQPAPNDLIIDGIVTLAFDADLHIARIVLMAASLGEPDRMGLFEFDPATFARTQLVAPVLADAAWAAGAAAPVGSENLQSTSLVNSASHSGLVRKVGDHHVYLRQMSDGGTTLFVGPLSQGPARELALFPVTRNFLTPIHIWNPNATNLSGSFSGSSGGITTASGSSLLAWHEWGGGAVDDRLQFWDDGAQKTYRCPFSAFGTPTGIAAPDAARVLFMSSANVAFSQTDMTVGGPVLLVQPDAADPCTVLADRGTSAGFSPDGASLFWLAQTPRGDSELWAAAGDGTGRRLLGTGAINRARFVGNGRMAFTLGEDLVWLDLHDETVRLHYIAEKTFDSSQQGLAWPWMVIGYQKSAGDGTGILGLVNGDSGVKRAISPWVSQYRYFWTPPFPALPLHVIFQVRGRDPSPQDGLWLAEITAADLLQ